MNCDIQIHPIVVELLDIPKIHGYFITYLLGLFSNKTVVIAAVRKSRRLRVSFPMLSLDIEKLQTTFPHCNKPPISNLDASNLVNMPGQRKIRQFIDSTFEALCEKCSLHSLGRVIGCLRVKLVLNVTLGLVIKDC